MPLERPPRVKVVEKVVESLDLLFARVGIPKVRDRLNLGESAFTGEDRAKDLGVLVGGDGLRVRNLVLNVPVDGIELTSSLLVGESLVGYCQRCQVPLFMPTHPSGYT